MTEEDYSGFQVSSHRLPPYSPELSPIELCWSKLKQCLRWSQSQNKRSYIRSFDSDCD
ncbi:MAG: hypothetical protein F6K10_12715 [Moorea sp. SIO2B7]|nr:hypothetical protein [Moorena sp. SIO2B7]